MKGRIKDLGFGMLGDLTVTLSLPRQHADSLKKLMDADIEADIKKFRERRSLYLYPGRGHHGSPG